MTRLFLSATALALFIVHSSLAAPRRVVFDGTESTQKWTLKDLNPDRLYDGTG